MAYKNIHETFWTDPKIKQLQPFERYLLLYFITNPHAHQTGIYYLPKYFMLTETALSEQNLDPCLNTLISNNLIKYDSDLNIIWVINMFKYQACNRKHNEMQLKGVARHLSMLHSSSLIKDFLVFYKNLQIPFEYQNNTPVDRGMNTPPYTDTDSVSDNDTDIDECKVEKISEAELKELKEKIFRSP